MFAKHILSAALVAGTLAATAGASTAMPMTKPTASSGMIETVGWRCGPHRHMNRWGRCVFNRPVFFRPAPVRAWHHGYWYHHRWHPGFWR